MAIWPFGRKSKKTKQAEDQNMAASRNLQPDTTRREPHRAESDRSAPTLGRNPSRKDSQRRRRSSTGKLTKPNHSRTREPEKTEATPAVPAIPQAHRQNELNEKTGADKANRQITSPPNDRGDVPSYYFQNPLSTSSLQADKNFSVLQPVPTLQGKNEGVMRRKSSKRKADRAREEEIKTMSSPIPIPKRPMSHNPGIMARDSKKIAGGLDRNLNRPLSDISLPRGDSLHSAMSISSDQHAYKVSAFDALSPRPTIRYSEKPLSASGSIGPSRTSTRKDKQPMIPEEETGKRSYKRIDDLADDMDAGTLKELMERDRRRIEKKRTSDREKLERKLQRKAEKQKEKEEKAGTSPEEARERGPPKDEEVGLGIAGTSAAPDLPESSQEPTRDEAVKTPESWLKDPSKERLPVEDPFHDPVVGSARSHLEAPSIPEEREEPVYGTAKEVRVSGASMSPPTSPARNVQEPSNLSMYQQLASTSTPDIPEAVDIDQRRDSDSSTRFPTNWRSIFRRSDTRAKRNSSDRGRGTPSEFSNTSRESIARQMEGRQMPPSAYNRVPRARSGTPIRTQSRFKEDLPELPISPPDSRMQSPEAGGQSPLSDIPGSRGTDMISSTAPLSDIHPAFREEVALSRNASLRANSPEGPASALMSQSLASVDSEGSWLTGRPVKRLSQPHARESASSLSKRLEEQQRMEEAEEEIPGTPEEEKYMGTLTPAPDEPPIIPERKRPYMGAATNIGSDSDDDSSLQPAPTASAVPQEEGTWHGAVGKHPTIVRQGPGPRARSREGLLNDFQNAEESEESSPAGDSPTSHEHPFPTIQRATSVDVGKGHARHISAGSARLLNLPPRSSGELKRFSASSGASGERSPLSPSMPSPSMPSPRMPETHEDDVD